MKFFLKIDDFEYKALLEEIFRDETKFSIIMFVNSISPIIDLKELQLYLKIRKLFNSYDQDKKGKITQDSFKEMIKKTGHKAGKSFEEIQNETIKLSELIFQETEADWKTFISCKKLFDVLYQNLYERDLFTLLDDEEEEKLFITEHGKKLEEKQKVLEFKEQQIKKRERDVSERERTISYIIDSIKKREQTLEERETEVNKVEKSKNGEMRNFTPGNGTLKKEKSFSTALNFFRKKELETGQITKEEKKSTFSLSFLQKKDTPKLNFEPIRSNSPTEKSSNIKRVESARGPSKFGQEELKRTTSKNWLGL